MVVAIGGPKSWWHIKVGTEMATVVVTRYNGEKSSSSRRRRVKRQRVLGKVSAIIPSFWWTQFLVEPAPPANTWKVVPVEKEEEEKEEAELMPGDGVRTAGGESRDMGSLSGISYYICLSVCVKEAFL